MKPLQIMLQNLRPIPCDKLCPEQWEVPIQPEGGGNIVAMVYGSSRTDEASKRECLERAALFSAAPDLLAACKSVMAFLSNGTPVRPGALVQAEVFNAIRKAEGK